MAFADVVALAVTYLGNVVAPVTVTSRVPKTRPAEFVQVRRAGGVPRPPVKELVRLDVFTWAESDPRALELGTDVRTAMWALSGTTLLGVTVYEVDEFKSLDSADDELTGTPRSWSTYALVIRANEIIHTPDTP